MARQLRLLVQFSVMLGSALSPVVVLAADVSSEIHTTAQSETNAAKPEIIADEKSQTVRIRIDGKDVAVFDYHGLHVLGDVNYSGSMTDVGGSVLSDVGEGDGH